MRTGTTKLTNCSLKSREGLHVQEEQKTGEGSITSLGPVTMTAAETDRAVRDTIESMRLVNRAAEIVKDVRDPHVARAKLIELGAEFEGDSMNFELGGLKAKLVGPKGEVGKTKTQRAARNAAKRARKARKAGRK